jgi:hypothetical protein
VGFDTLYQLDLAGPQRENRFLRGYGRSQKWNDLTQLVTMLPRSKPTFRGAPAEACFRRPEERGRRV